LLQRARAASHPVPRAAPRIRRPWHKKPLRQKQPQCWKLPQSTKSVSPPTRRSPSWHTRLRKPEVSTAVPPKKTGSAPNKNFVAAPLSALSVTRFNGTYGEQLAACPEFPRLLPEL